jgi:hypothetical protein
MPGKTLVRAAGALVALVVACLGGPAAAGPVGPAETFEGDAVGSFPAGWRDFANVDPVSTIPKPSAVVVSTTDAFGHPTRALAPVDAIASMKGIYRAVGRSSLYETSADVRIDRFSDFSTSVDCGCPPELQATFDWPMTVGFLQLQGTTDPAHVPVLGLLASSWTKNWRLLAFTENVAVDVDLGVPVTLGTWYGLQIELNAVTGSVHSRITDVATGAILANSVTSLPAASLLPGGPWNPATDGNFNAASYFAGELTGMTTPGLAVVDNIDTLIPEPTTMLLLASALAACLVARRRR